MTTEVTAITFQPEPPLREGQFLRSPVLHHGQAIRALVVLAIAIAAISLLSLRPAHATAGTASNVTVATSMNAGEDANLVTQRRVDLAQLDLTRTRRTMAKKKHASR